LFAISVVIVERDATLSSARAPESKPMHNERMPIKVFITITKNQHQPNPQDKRFSSFSKVSELCRRLHR
jgi:hypothetical protein